MPLYEYRCRDCDKRVTIRHGYSDSASPHCPLCNGENLTRLISHVSVVKSSQDRVRDLSWVDRDLARRLKKKASGKLNPALQETLDRMESHQ